MHITVYSNNHIDPKWSFTFVMQKEISDCQMWWISTTNSFLHFEQLYLKFYKFWMYGVTHLAQCCSTWKTTVLRPWLVSQIKKVQTSKKIHSWDLYSMRENSVKNKFPVNFVLYACMDFRKDTIYWAVKIEVQKQIQVDIT